MLLVDEWEYKCEGIGNIILTYVGQQEQYKNHVLRIRKKSSFETHHQTTTTTINTTDNNTNNHSNSNNSSGIQHYVYEYVKRVMQPLIGHSVVNSGSMISLQQQSSSSSTFLMDIDEKIRDKRPLYRVNKGDPIDFSANTVLLLPDYTTTTTTSSSSTTTTTTTTDDNNNNNSNQKTFSVEIKPKWGMMCYSSHFHNNNNNNSNETKNDDDTTDEDDSITTTNNNNIHHKLKYHYCRYCMHQVLKHQSGSIKQTSSFCPMDLYSSSTTTTTTTTTTMSGSSHSSSSSSQQPSQQQSSDDDHDDDRLKHGLKQLVQSPQNNLRVYVNGQLEWHADMEQRHNSDFQSELIQLLLKSTTTSTTTTTDQSSLQEHSLLLDRFLNQIMHCLKDSKVLQYLQRVQLLDVYDVQVIHTILNQLLSSSINQYSINDIHEKLFPFSSTTNEKDDTGDMIEQIVQQIQSDLLELKNNNFVCHRWSSSVSSLISSPPRPQFNTALYQDNIIEKCKQDEALALHVIRNFLIAQCAKDCSIMMTFVWDNNSNEMKMNYRLGVVDLDPKPVTKIQHYAQMDDEIVKLFASHYFTTLPAVVESISSSNSELSE